MFVDPYLLFSPKDIFNSGHSFDISILPITRCQGKGKIVQHNDAETKIQVTFEIQYVGEVKKYIFGHTMS